jgi:hypothetical protein
VKQLSAEALATYLITGVAGFIESTLARAARDTKVKRVVYAALSSAYDDTQLFLSGGMLPNPIPAGHLHARAAVAVVAIAQVSKP